MKVKGQYKKLGFILVVISIICGSQTLHSQEVKSKVVKFKINNVKDLTPPSIKIMTPEFDGDFPFQTQDEEIVIIGQVLDKSGIKFVSVDDNIRLLNEAGIFTSRIYLYPGKNKVLLLASDNYGNVQEKFVTIEYSPPVVTLADKIEASSKYFGLIIGINSYKDPSLPDLENPIEDSEKVYNTLISKYSFAEDNMILLSNPKRTDIVDALDYLAATVSPNDNLLIFYAGHGTWDERANIGYWLPTDAYMSSTANWFRNSTLVDYLKQIDSKHTLLIADACFAGSIFKTRAGFPEAEKAYDVYYNLCSRKAMTSGSFTEVPDRSAFTKYLLQRLNDNDGLYLSSWELYNSFRNAVINNSDAVPNYGEIQNVGDEGGDFIFLKKNKNISK